MGSKEGKVLLKRKRIHYLAHYSCGENIDNYNVAVPARKKMDYILYALEKAGYEIDVFSVANSKNKNIIPPKVVRISEQLRVQYSLSFRRGNKFLSLLSTLLRFIQIVGYILFRMSTNSTLLVYHSNSFIRPINFARHFKKIRLVIDIEEVYSKLFNDDPKEALMEKSFLLTGDSYITVNDILAKQYGVNGKTAIVVYGDYRMNYIHGLSWGDELTHVVYAGTIERNKLGAFTAAETARLFTKEYKMHIIGFGKEDVIRDLKEKADDINNEKGFEVVKYDGYKTGRDLDEYLSKCDIGLSTYILTDSFANNSFPSKLMSYVTHNLQVVTGDARAFREAKVATNWLFYKNYSPESIAQTIMSYKKGSLQNNEIIVNELNQSFITSLRLVL